MTNKASNISFEITPHDGAALELSTLRYGRRSGEFEIALSAPGFTAERYLSADDLRAIRDWIDTELENEVAA